MILNDSIINANDNSISNSKNIKKKSPYFFNDPKLSKMVEEKNINLNLSKLKNLKDPDINDLRRKYLDYEFKNDTSKNNLNINMNMSINNDQQDLNQWFKKFKITKLIIIYKLKIIMKKIKNKI